MAAPLDVKPTTDAFESFATKPGMTGLVDELLDLGEAAPVAAPARPVPAEALLP
jgi:hypothetical protein